MAQPRRATSEPSVGLLGTGMTRCCWLL